MGRTRVKRNPLIPPTKPRKRRSDYVPRKKDNVKKAYHERKLEALEATATFEWQRLACKRARDIRRQIEDKDWDSVRQVLQGKYCPLTHPAMVVQAMSKGAGIEELALEIGVTIQCLRNWYKEHEEFRLAVEQGIDLAKAWWMRQGRINLDNPHFNTSLFRLNMTNRFGWGTKIQTDGPAQVINNINIEGDVIDVKQIPTDLLEQLAAAMPDQKNSAIDVPLLPERFNDLEMDEIEDDFDLDDEHFDD